jgi:hypothetical protein
MTQHHIPKDLHLQSVLSNPTEKLEISEEK